MTTWTCVTCNMNCERIDPTEEEMDDLQYCYCPYMDAYTEWVKDEGDDDDEERESRDVEYRSERFRAMEVL